jgi:hypothetical protein
MRRITSGLPDLSQKFSEYEEPARSTARSAGSGSADSQPDQQAEVSQPAKTQAANSQPDPPGLTTEGDRATARDSSQPTQVFLGSSPSAGDAFGGKGGCCVELYGCTLMYRPSSAPVHAGKRETRSVYSIG